jgi:hypothetical protein
MTAYQWDVVYAVTTDPGCDAWDVAHETERSVSGARRGLRQAERAGQVHSERVPEKGRTCWWPVPKDEE